MDDVGVAPDQTTMLEKPSMGSGVRAGQGEARGVAEGVVVGGGGLPAARGDVQGGVGTDILASRLRHHPPGLTLSSHPPTSSISPPSHAPSTQNPPLTTALHLRPNLQFDFSIFAESSLRCVGVPSQSSREEERERRLRQHVLALAEAHAVGDWALVRRWGKKVRGEASAEGDVVQRVAWYMLQALEARADGTAVVKWRAPIEFQVKVRRWGVGWGGWQRMAWYMLQALKARADGTAAVKWRAPIEFQVKPFVSYALSLPSSSPFSHAQSVPDAVAAVGYPDRTTDQHCKHLKTPPSIPFSSLTQSAIDVMAAMGRSYETSISAEDMMAAVGHSHETSIVWINFAFAALLHEVPLQLDSALDASTFGHQFFGQLAKVLGLPLTFEMVDVPLESLHPGMVKVHPGEEVVVVSLWTLMLFPDDSVLRHNPRDAVLKWIQALKPRLVLLAEVDAALNGPFFLARVREIFRTMLAFISAVHATMPDSAISPVRFIWEGLMFRELINCVGCEGIQRLIRAERLEQWEERMGRLGFEEVGLGREALAAMRETTEGRDGRFEVVSVGGAARLMWKGQPVLAAEQSAQGRGQQQGARGRGQQQSARGRRQSRAHKGAGSSRAHEGAGSSRAHEGAGRAERTRARAGAGRTRARAAAERTRAQAEQSAQGRGQQQGARGRGQQQTATGGTGTGSNGRQQAAQAWAATGGNRQHRHGQQRAAQARGATGGNGQHRHGQQQAAQAQAATGSNGQHRHGQQQAATGSTSTGSNGQQRAARARAATGSNKQHRHGQQRAATGSTGTGSNGRQQAAQARAATGSNRQHKHRQQQAAAGSTRTGSNGRQRAAPARAATGGNGQHRHGQQRAATGSTGTGSNGQHRHGQQRAATGSTGTGSNGQQRAARARAATGNNKQ
ncbi:unnamed protein product [Closterium sp. NIES-65]|nr:unnamed protein product [Closterium sp. NIES-65]